MADFASPLFLAQSAGTKCQLQYRLLTTKIETMVYFRWVLCMTLTYNKKIHQAGWQVTQWVIKEIKGRQLFRGLFVCSFVCCVGVPLLRYLSSTMTDFISWVQVMQRAH